MLPSFETLEAIHDAPNEAATSDTRVQSEI